MKKTILVQLIVILSCILFFIGGFFFARDIYKIKIIPEIERVKEFTHYEHPEELDSFSFIIGYLSAIEESFIVLISFDVDKNIINNYREEIYKKQRKLVSGSEEKTDFDKWIESTRDTLK